MSRSDNFGAKTLVENIVDLNRQQGRKPRKQRGKPAVRSIEPRALEKQYQKRLTRIIKEFKKIVKVNIVSQLPALVAEADIAKGKQDHARLDQSVFTKVRSLVQATRSGLEGLYSRDEISKQAREAAGTVDRFNKDKLNKTYKALVGIDLAMDDPFITEMLNIFAEDNAELIINISDNVMSGIQTEITRGLRKGTRAPQIAQKILGRVKDKEGFKSVFAKAETRAKLIARDQINKLNGDLNRQRQETVGVKKYIWRTSRDERVRDSHQLEGEIFTWTGTKSESGKSKPRGGLNPGEDFNCRCWAEPFFEDL